MNILRLDARLWSQAQQKLLCLPDGKRDGSFGVDPAFFFTLHPQNAKNEEKGL